MIDLVLHPDCTPGPVQRVRAAIRATDSGCTARFRIDGDMAGIVVPASAPSVRTSDLWRSTCFEAFWAGEGAESYTELNISPSTQWAAWRFVGYRGEAMDAVVEGTAFASTASDAHFEMEASMALSLPLPARIALTAVIKTRDGALQYWAPAFAPGKPDFHAAACRTIQLEDER